jgi:hypothetical protein
LRVGTTALIVALIEEGYRPGIPVDIVSPVKAMARFAADTECNALVKLASGERITAVGIQRQYLQSVEANLNASFMPDWAEYVCQMWRNVLDKLESCRRRPLN